jgi:hypothetical protein
MRSFKTPHAIITISDDIDAVIFCNPDACSPSEAVSDSNFKASHCPSTPDTPCPPTRLIKISLDLARQSGHETS